jgi:hypothetical protein
MNNLIKISLCFFILIFTPGLNADDPVPYGMDGYYGPDGYYDSEGNFGPDIVPNYNPGDPGMVDNQNNVFDQNEEK